MTKKILSVIAIGLLLFSMAFVSVGAEKSPIATTVKNGSIKKHQYNSKFATIVVKVETNNTIVVYSNTNKNYNFKKWQIPSCFKITDGYSLIEDRIYLTYSGNNFEKDVELIYATYIDKNGKSYKVKLENEGINRSSPKTSEYWLNSIIFLLLLLSSSLICVSLFVRGKRG